MNRPHRRALVAAVVILAAVALPAIPAAVQARSEPRTSPSRAASLPQVTSGRRPGPEVLYAPPPTAPQLENADTRFRAPFDRISGTERYVDGEYLYTDHLYDDGGSGGDNTYPTNRDRYADNAADLVEFRISTLARRQLTFRFTLNTLLAGDTTMAIAAFDTDANPETGSATLPYDPRSPFPGTDAVLTAWGTGATWSTWDSGTWLTSRVPASVDVGRNQLVASVPVAVAKPSGTWRTTVGVGLRDAATGGFLLPGEEATESQPGGGDVDCALFNLGFRFDEPIVSTGDAPDAAQSDALVAHEPTRFANPIDMDGLLSGSDRTRAPAKGTQVRFFPSRLSRGEGKNLDEFPAFLGQLQPYTLFVPSSYEPGTPTPLTLNLHSLGERHWQYTGSDGIAQMGEGRGNLVATADARGEDGWYQNEAEYDVFEMWNDIAAHFSLDPDRTSLTGYSMGGYATYRLGTLYPDLFARAASVVGPPGDGIWLGAGAPTGGAETLSNLWLENARNLPFLNIVAGADEFVPIPGTTQQNLGPAYNGRTSFDALGYRFTFDVYPVAEHLTLAILGYDLPQLAAFLGNERVDRSPFHVTWAYTPAADDPALGLVHDKAYWVSDVRVRDAAVGPKVSSTADPLGKGVIDAESLAFGIDDALSTTAQGGGTTPLPFVENRRTWGEPVPRAAVNGVVVSLTNVASATLDLPRARIDSLLPVHLSVVSDGPATLTLVGADGRTSTVDVTGGVATFVVAPASFH